MSNRTFVCLKCRTSRRSLAAYGKPHEFRCAECSKGLIELPWERQIPTKKNDEGWRVLKTYLAELKAGVIPQKKPRPALKPKGIRSLFQLPARKRKQSEAQNFNR